MNKTKKALSIVLSFVLIMSLFTVGFSIPASAVTNVNYTVSEDGKTVTITKGTYYSPQLALNETEKSTVEKVVAEEGTVFKTSCWKAFFNYSKIREIDLSNVDMTQVTSMKQICSSCSSLESIIFNNDKAPTGLESMLSAFFGCKSLTSIDLSNFGLSDTISNNDIKSIFKNCNNLVQITLPDGFKFGESTLLNSGDGYIGWVSEDNPSELAFGTGDYAEADSVSGGTYYRVAKTSTYYPAKEATCEEDGNNEYWLGSDGNKYNNIQCLDGQRITDDITIPKKYHQLYDVWRWSKDYKSATVTLICETCGKTLEEHTVHIDEYQPAGDNKTTLFASYTSNDNVTYNTAATVDGQFNSETHEFELNKKFTVTNNYRTEVNNTTSEIVKETISDCSYGQSITLKSSVPKVKSNGSEIPMYFSHWEKITQENGTTNVEIVSTCETYSFIVCEDVNVYAVYVDDVNNAKSKNVIANIKGNNTIHSESKYLTFTMDHSLPENCVVEEVGIKYTFNSLAGLNDDNTTDLSDSNDVSNVLTGDDSSKYRTFKARYKNTQGTTRLNFGIGDKTSYYVYAMGYIKYKDTNDQNQETKTLTTTLVSLCYGNDSGE